MSHSSRKYHFRSDLRGSKLPVCQQDSGLPEEAAQRAEKYGVPGHLEMMNVIYCSVGCEGEVKVTSQCGYIVPN